MQKIQLFLSVFLFVCAIVSCAEDSPSTPVIINEDSPILNKNQEEKSNDASKLSSDSDEQLIGSWLVVNVVGEHKDLNMGLIYTWTREGKMSMEREFYVEGTYTVKNGVIVWTTKDFEFTYNFTISGELMTLIPDNSGHTYTLKRR